MSKIICEVCGTPVEREEISEFAGLSGLPSPCCKICFEVRDYSDTNLETVVAKSLLKREKTLNGDFDFAVGEVFISKGDEVEYVVIEKCDSLNYLTESLSPGKARLRTSPQFMIKKI